VRASAASLCKSYFRKQPNASGRSQTSFASVARLRAKLTGKVKNRSGDIWLDVLLCLFNASVFHKSIDSID
jgi:hypothetical protein